MGRPNFRDSTAEPLAPPRGPSAASDAWTARRVGITGRVRFRFDDGSFIEWSTKEPKTVAEMHELIDRWAALVPKSADTQTAGPAAPATGLPPESRGGAGPESAVSETGGES